MKASEWLVRATQDLPAGVTARVKADTLVHLQDAGVDEAADVRPLLGRPADTAAELKRLYLTNKEWQEYQKSRPSSTGFDPSEWLVLGWPALLMWSVFDDRVPFHGVWFVQGLLAVLFLVMLAWTGRMHPLRRRSWRLWSLALCSLPLQWTYFNEVIFGGELWLSVPILCAVLVYGAQLQYGRDARLARTLSLENGRT